MISIDLPFNQRPVGLPILKEGAHFFDNH